MFVCHSAHKVVPVPGPAQLSPSSTLGPSPPPLCTGLWPQPLHPGDVQTCSLENVDGWQAGSWHLTEIPSCYQCEELVAFYITVCPKSVQFDLIAPNNVKLGNQTHPSRHLGASFVTAANSTKTNLFS